MLVGLAVPAVALSAQPAAAATEAVSLSQCTNGGVSPLTLNPCLNGTLGTTSYSDWVNGNANGSKSHWKEGQFIAYRADITGLGAGTHTYTIHYHTVESSKHAIDYLGSYDATETTSPTAGPENRNDSNPCFDILHSGAGSGCTAPGTAPTPAATTPVPAANLTADKTCNGASGLSTTPTQVPGTFDLFAPTAAGATMTSTDASYVSQEVTSGTGVCITTMSITFNLSGAAPSGGWEVVLAWGGHIASALDWGVGNSASAINGSPYHMAQDSIDTTGLGSQDRALATTGVAGPPTVATQVSKTSISVGGSLTDTATLTGSAGTVTGTVQFQLCSNTTTGCPQGTGTNIGSPVTLSGGVATSAPFGSNLVPGNYCVGLIYTNDGNSFYSSTYSGSATNECFTVTKAGPTISTQLSSSSVSVGGSVHDSATLSGETSNAGGTVDYRYYSSLSDCTADTSAFPGTPPTRGTDVGSQTVTSGTVPNSASATFNSAGTFYWAAFYSGDSNNIAAASVCSTETLTVGKASPTITTQLNANPIPIDSSTFDTATLHGASANAGGTVDYRFYPDQGTCAGDSTGTGGTDVGSVPVTNGSVPPSPPFTFHNAGTFPWRAFYSGDANNAPAASDCSTELLVVNQASPTITTQLSATSGTAPVTVHDSATLHNASANAGGTVDYRFYTSQTACAGDSTGTSGTDVGKVTVSGGVVPNSPPFTFNNAGTFYWAAFYSGDANNKAAVSSCSSEVLVVGQAGVTGQITPTSTTCQQFLSGTAKTLTRVTYQTKGMTTIQGAQPGVFFYYVKVTAPSSSFTVDIPQTIASPGTGPLFGIQQTVSYDASCNALKITKGGTGSDDVITFSKATAGQIYVVGVKYSVKSIVGKPKPSPANITYIFSANLNSVLVPGSKQMLNLVKTG